jgi:hypothetical protein
VYDVYESDRIPGYDEMATVSEMMQKLSLSILSNTSVRTASEEPLGGDAAIAALARHCYTLSIDLGKRLDKTRAKNRNIKDIVKAAVRHGMLQARH